jgi:hypothetical protein
VLDEALRLGEDLSHETEARVIAYGRWLLDQIFEGDSTAALDDKSQNPVWLELVRRAGGPTLRVSRHLLYVAVRVAAYDRRITAQSWRGLDAGRKELLLPLGEERRLRDAAQHVSDMNLSQGQDAGLRHRAAVRRRQSTPRPHHRHRAGRARTEAPCVAGRRGRASQSPRPG